MNKNLVIKTLFVILIFIIFYCVYKNYSVLREGINIAKCSDIKNCQSCAKETTGEGICYWCDNKCVKAGDFDNYNSCTRKYINNPNCTALDTQTPTPSCPDCPLLLDIPAGTKMTKQRV
jgi:hypothetical protein